MRVVSTLRQPAGVPTGGQFAANERTEDATTLSRPIGEVRRDFMQLQFAANDARFRLSSHAALLTIDTIKQVAPTATTAVFFHEFENDWLRLAELRDENGDELSSEVLQEADLATTDYRAAMVPGDYFILGFNDEESETTYGVTKTVSLRGEPLTDQAAMRRRMNLDLAAAGVNHHDVAPALLETLIMRFRDDDNEDGVDAVYNLDANDIYEMYDRHIGPMIDRIEKEIKERV